MHGARPLERAMHRALVRRTSGVPSLRKHVLAQTQQWRLEGVDDHDILAAFLDLLQRVACTTGDDRTDLLTGEPRWAAVAEVIERAIDSTAPASTFPFPPRDA
jgi:hypothetical protein